VWKGGGFEKPDPHPQDAPGRERSAKIFQMFRFCPNNSALLFQISRNEEFYNCEFADFTLFLLFRYFDFTAILIKPLDKILGFGFIGS
jgi:hypothetical protein